MRTTACKCLVLGLLVLPIWGCSSDDPSGPVAAPVRFDPSGGAFAMQAFDTLVLKVLGEGNPQATFYLNDVEVARGSTYSWVADLEGESVLRAVAQSGGVTYSAEWRVTVSDDEALPTPKVTILRADRGADPGSIALQWEAPPESRYDIPIKRYRVGFSDSPIPDDFAGVQVIEVDHIDDVVLQNFQLDGLEEKRVHHVRVQTVDVFDREAILSDEVTSVSTGHYTVSGQVSRLPLNGPGVEGMAEVLVAIGEYKAFSDANGFYVVENIPDYFRADVDIKPSNPDEVNDFYWLSADRPDTVDTQLDALMMRLRRFSIFYATGPKEEWALWWLQKMSNRTSIGAAQDVQHWAEIPIQVQADDHVLSNGVNYGQAMRAGIDAWNRVAGMELLVAVAGRPEKGVYYTPNLQTGGGSVLGQVDVVTPSGADLYDSVPEVVRMQLHEFYSTQGFADRVVVHELGHVLQMTHSTGIGHVMVAGVNSVSPDEPTPEEAWAARFLQMMPLNTDLDWYVEPN